MSNLYLCFEKVINGLVEISQIKKEACNYNVEDLEVLKELAAYLSIETSSIFNQKIEVKCSFEKRKREQFSYILLIPSKRNKKDGDFYIPVIFDFEKQYISISLVLKEQKPDNADMSGIISYAEAHCFPNGIAEIANYIKNPIKTNIPEKGIFASQIYSKDKPMEESPFYRYLKDIAYLCNRL